MNAIRETPTPKRPRKDLGAQLRDIELLASSLARQEREGAPARELEVKLMLLQGAINETRQTASDAVAEEEAGKSTVG